MNDVAAALECSTSLHLSDFLHDSSTAEPHLIRILGTEFWFSRQEARVSMSSPSKPDVECIAEPFLLTMASFGCARPFAPQTDIIDTGHWSPVFREVPNRFVFRCMDVSDTGQYIHSSRSLTVVQR